jgi:hypothetical protein
VTAIARHPIEDHETIAFKPHSPAFTGTLFLPMVVGSDPTAVRLLSLSSGLHFRSMRLRWGHPNNLTLMRALVKKCSSTLESLEIRSKLIGMPSWHPCVRTADSRLQMIRR